MTALQARPDIINFILEHPGLSFREYGRQLGVSDSTIRRHWNLAGGDLAGGRVEILPEAVYELPDRVPVDYMERIKVGLVPPPLRFIVESDKNPVGIAADFHLPLFSPEWFNRMLDWHTQNGVKMLLTLGDFLNLDALSNYYPKQRDAGYDTERKTARATLGLLLRVYETVVLIKGNHDARLVKRSNYALDFVQAMDAYFEGVPGIERAQFSNFDHLLVTDLSAPHESSPDWWMGHAKSYSRTPLGQAIKLADINRMNTITAHSHHLARGYSSNGEFVVAEIGGLFDRHRTEYLASASVYPHWTNGYGMLRNGRLQLQGKGWNE
jgi:hypothetical protein